MHIRCLQLKKMRALGSTGRLIAGRQPGGVTAEGQQGFVQLSDDALPVEVSVPERGRLPGRAEDGLDVREVAKPLRINSASNQRRYAGQRGS
jgi:hypothetical protein